MNKKLMKNRVSRRDTLQAMACRCVCSCSCPNECSNCSGGGSWKATEETNRLSSAVHSRIYADVGKVNQAKRA